jgi:Flp pilus assembly protein TadD
VKYPSNYEIWAKQGDCLSKLGKKVKARKAYKTALNIKPGYEGAVKGLKGL